MSNSTSLPGPSVKFLPLGALIQELYVGDTNIVLGFPSTELYVSHNAPYFGETTGRVANRVSGAKINSLNNGQSYQLASNDGANSLHGGVKGWGKQIWEGPKLVNKDGKEGVVFRYLSKDGDEGYPGDLDFTVTYIAYTDEKGAVVLDIEYEGELVGPDNVQETVLNVTNHSYFNLTGGSSIEGTEVTLASDLHQAVDSASIPTGPLEPYPGVTANKTFTLGPVEPDIDHCFIMNTDPASVPIDTRPLELQLLTKFYHPESKIHLEVLSTDPAFQFYTGKYIDVPAVGGLPARKARSGFCVEPSRYVDAVNREEWKNQVLLKKGEKYGSKIVYRAWKD